MSGPTFGVQATRRASVLPVAILQSLDATIERLRGVIFESLDFASIMRRYDRPTTLFYVDPPYAHVSQPYARTLVDDDHRRLADALGPIRGHWLLSYNDCPEIRHIYRQFKKKRLTTRYTIGCNSPTEGSSQGHELLISNRSYRVRNTARA